MFTSWKTRKKMKIKLLLIALLIFTHTNINAENLSNCRDGWTNIKSENYDHAVDLIDKCISEGQLSNANLALSYRNRGLALKRSGKYQEAIESYDKALTLKPHDPWVDYVNRGNTWSELKNYKKALDEYDLAFKVKPHYNEAHYNKGIVYERLKKTDEATQEFETAYQYGLRSDYLLERLHAYGLTNLSKPNKLKNFPTASIDKTVVTLDDAKNITSVFAMEDQLCSSAMVLTQLTKYPGSKAIQSSKEINLSDLGSLVSSA